MADFTQGQIVHLSSGRRAEFVSAVDDKFLVKLATIYVEADEEMEVFDELSVQAAIFHAAPTASIAKDVTALMERRAALRGEVDALLTEQREAQRVGKEYLDRCARHTRLGLLADYLDGKITHIVSSQSGNISISTFAEAFQILEGNYHPRWDGKSLKLLTLFGNTKGDLQWQINSYGDGSGGGRDVFPCCSEQEAQETAARVINARWDDVRKTPWPDPATNTIKSADALGVEVPADVRQIVRQSKIDSKMSYIASQQESIKKMEAELAAMESAP